MAKVHGSLARAGKVRSQAPKVEKVDKPKKVTGRALKREKYIRRFVNVTAGPGGKIIPSLQNEYSDLKEKVIKLCQQDRRNNRRLEIKKASDLMLGNKSRELWNWIKRVSGRFRSSLTDGPIYNKNKELITETKAKAVAWAAHFEELAKDSTGNSRSPEKWKDIRNNIATFPECDSPLTWKEITEVLKSTPNNKSP
ncbi:40S ribosomal protein S30, partial [Smittium culicis]